MTHLTYISLIIATICNALQMSLCRLNNPIYHTFETATVILYIAFGGLVAWQAFTQPWLRIAKYWIVLFLMVRFSIYSAVWGYVAYKNPLYLGDGAWTDRIIKTVLFDWMNQGPGALGFLYIIVGLWSLLLYLRLNFSNKTA